MKRIEAIDIFCGIGGLTQGLKQSGIFVVAGLDNDASCKYAYEVNNNARFIHADISKYNLNYLSSLYSEDSVRVLVGCAPCQPFSSHNFKKFKKTERRADSRWNLLEYFTESIEVVQPHVVSMENVRGLVKEAVFSFFIQELEKLGYNIDFRIVNCADYGVPQNRSRLVLLASRLGNISIPPATHRKQEYVTVSQTIAQLPPIAAGESSTEDPVHRAKNLSPLNLQRMEQSQPGGSWRDWDYSLLPECFKKASGRTYTTVYGRARWDSPAPTITTQFYNYGSGRFGHPEQNRAFSIREGSLLQSFPVDYNFGNTTILSVIGKQIGNAVPPLLAYNIGRAIFKHVQRLRGEQEYTKE